MESTYQEKILSAHHGYEAIKDCFAITRLQRQIESLEVLAVVNEETRKQMQEKCAELYIILAKYDDVLKNK